MQELEANVARYQFRAARLPSDTFQLVRFSGTEEISGLFEFRLTLVSEDFEIDFDRVVNEQSTLSMMRGDELTRFQGIITSVEQHGRSADFAEYHVVMRPRLWRLTLTRQSRIFQNMKVEEIVSDVLRDAGLNNQDFEFKLSNAYDPREYCVQYNESDLNFIQRLLEHEGIYYFFQHDEERDVLVITDDRGKHDSIEGASAVTFHQGAGMVEEDLETIHELILQQQVVTGRFLLKDYNYETPDNSLQVESHINRDMPGVQYEYGQHYGTAAAGRRLAEVRNQEIECRRRILKGGSNCAGFRSGALFELRRHYRSDFNDDYLLTSVRHRGDQAGAMNLPGDSSQSDGEQVQVYTNEFVCIPANVQYRPPRGTPRPAVPGIMTAQIDTAGGDYAYIDEDGRYRARMHFDVSGAGNGTASPPVRMAQPYAGNDYGIHFPNHAGTEMLWACVNGDIDRPVIIGSVYNGNHKSPATSTNKMHNVVRTFGGNQIILDDTMDEAQVVINTPNDHIILLDDREDKIEILTTGKHRITFDDENRNITVRSTEGHEILIDDENEKINVQSRKGHRLTLNDSDGSESIIMSDADQKNFFQIDISNKKITIESAEGDIALAAPRGSIQLNAKEIVTDSSGDTKMDAANLTAKAKSDYKMNGQNVTVEAGLDYKQKGMNVTSEAGMNHKSKGTNVASEATLNNEVKGTLISVKAAGLNQIQGALVKIN